MYQNNIIQQVGTNGTPVGNTVGQNVPNRFLPKLQQARASGVIEEYKFDNFKPKKKLKELHKVLVPEKKKLLFIKYGYKFNLKERCVVCGMHHIWEAGDYLRPPIPLDRVERGRPLRGTYCPKHAAYHKQLEMLQQEILADEHGLDFKRFIPKPKMPQLMKSGPIYALSNEDIIALSSVGYIIKPPTLSADESKEAEVLRLTTELKAITLELDFLVNQKEE